jgi:predicted transcriptional regulator
MLSHYRSTQRNLLRTMVAIGSERPTLRQLQKSTGMSVRYLRYMITILRTHAIVKGERIGEEYRYRLSPEAFGEHIRVRYAKALENLVKKGHE